MPVRLLPLLTGLAPILAVHVSYLIAAYFEHVPWCNPYWESCTSISATGRRSPEYYWFKGTMIPVAMIMVLFWVCCFRWLQVLGAASARSARAIPILGTIGAGCLIVYTVALGAEGDPFRLQRRIGVIVYFTFTYLAQLLVTYRLRRLESMPELRPRLDHMHLLSMITLAIGVISLMLNIFYEDYDRLEDGFEWVLALLIHCYFLLMTGLWTVTGFSVTFQAKKRDPSGSL